MNNKNHGLHRMLCACLNLALCALLPAHASHAAGAATFDHPTYGPREYRIVTPEGSKVELRRVAGRKVYYVLPSTDSATPQPLILLLSYEGGTAPMMANLVYAGAHAVKGQRFAIPEASNGRWNNTVPGTGNPNKDLDFLVEVIHDAVSKVNTDASRIAVAGFSSGGFMADLFACTHSSLVKGLGMVAANQLDAASTQCQTQAGTRALFFHGTRDYTVAYDGTTYSLSAPETLNYWQNLLGCSGTVEATTLPSTHDRTPVVRSGIAGCGAALYTINGGGHNWPGGMSSPLDVLGHRSTDNIDATELMWHWFFGN